MSDAKNFNQSLLLRRTEVSDGNFLAKVYPKRGAKNLPCAVGARVSMIGASGEMRYALTNPFGFYRFADVPVGETYVFNVSHKRYRFASSSQVLFIGEERSDINFVSLPWGENDVREAGKKQVFKQP